MIKPPDRPRKNKKIALGFAKTSERNRRYAHNPAVIKNYIDRIEFQIEQIKDLHQMEREWERE